MNFMEFIGRRPSGIIESKESALMRMEEDTIMSAKTMAEISDLIEQASESLYYTLEGTSKELSRYSNSNIMEYCMDLKQMYESLKAVIQVYREEVVKTNQNAETVIAHDINITDISRNGIGTITESTKYEVEEEILRRYLTGLGMDIVEQNIVLEIVKENNPQMLHNLRIVNTYSGADLNTVLNEIVNYYNTSQECRMLSSEGIATLKSLELAEYQVRDLCELDEADEITGIWPYYVMVRDEELVGYHRDDGGITIGYGHNISYAEWLAEDEDSLREQALLMQYVPEDVKVTGILVEDSMLTSSGNVLVEGAECVPIEDANRILTEDIMENSREIAEYLEGEGIAVTQEQFDALVICRFNNGRLPQQARDNLRDGNMNPADWQNVWSGGERRANICQALFFGTEE